MQAAKLDVLTAAQDWYEQGSQLAVVVPALEEIVAAADPDAAFLACVAWSRPWWTGGSISIRRSPWSPPGNTPDLLVRLRPAPRAGPALTLSSGPGSPARSPTPSCPPTRPRRIADEAYRELLQHAGAGRYMHAGGLVFARGAHAFAMHGDTRRAIDLWRQAILLSSESRRYGDVLACRRALNAAILEQPVPAFSELDTTSSLPNDARLLAAAQ